jgi:Tfp pilus assembly protein PilN
MRLPLNLAREPMRRDRPMLVASAAVAILLCISLIALIGLAITDRRSMQESRQVIARVQKQLAKINAQQAQIDAQMRIPGNASVLYRSEMFNTLIHLKAISWTRIFSDLETVLPHDVRIVSIRPTLNGRDQLSLDMVVAANAPEPLIGFVVKLEASDMFPKLTQTVQTPPSQTDPYYHLNLKVTYDQKL